MVQDRSVQVLLDTNTYGTSPLFRVAFVLHGGIGAGRKSLESLGSDRDWLATRKGRVVRSRADLSLCYLAGYLVAGTGFEPVTFRL